LNIKAIFFDIGGTLYKEKKFEIAPWASKLSSFLKKQCLSIAPDKIYSTYVNVRDELIKCAIDSIEIWHLSILTLTLSKLNIIPNPRLVMEAYKLFTESLLEIMEPYNGVHEIMEWLKSKGLKIGIVSNTGSHHLIYRVLERDGLLKYVDSLVTSQMVSWRKPDRRIFLYACSTLNVKPSESVHVGNDPIADVLGAKNAGLTVIQKISEHALKSDLADAIIIKLEELKNIIEKLLHFS